MNFKKIVFFLTVLALPCSCSGTADSSQLDVSAQSTEFIPLRLPAVERLVAIGDLHGDLQATMKAFRLAGAIDDKGQWAGGNMTVVQTGDVLDRGDDEKAILDFLSRLQQEARKAGGYLHILNGNHEMMNTALDFRYVTEKGFTDFSGTDISGVSLQVPDFARPRAAAFMPGSRYAREFAVRNTVQLIGNTVFVHGGILPEHVEYGLEKINNDYRNWFTGKTPMLPGFLNTDSGPLWSRRFSDETPESDCKLLEETLASIPAQRMVVGHTVFDKINSECNGRLWRIDTGMSRYYGGKPQVLEITGDEQVRVIG